MKRKPNKTGATTMNPPRFLCALCCAIALHGLTTRLSAQLAPDTAAPRVPMYGIADDEFPIYAWTQKWVVVNPSDTGGNYRNNLQYLWPYADSMGFDIIWLAIGTSYSYVSDLHNSPYRDSTRHRMRVNADILREPAYARAIQFYPFDSVQSPYWVWKFTSVNGGFRDTNEAEFNVSEQVYENLADMGLIASAIALDYIPTEGRLIEKFYPWFTMVGGWGAFTSTKPRTSYIAVTGHLFTGGAAQDTDSIFTVAVYHEIKQGRQYLDVDSTVLTAGAGGAAYLVDSFAVTKAQLKADTNLVVERYRTIVHGTDFRWRFGGATEPGPLHPLQPHGEEQSVDIRVYWTGKEKAALRSVELRDSIAERLLGVGTASDNFRKQIMDGAKRMLLGSANGDIANLRTEVIAAELATESIWRPMEFACFEFLNRMLADTFNLPAWRAANGQAADPQPGDSLSGQQFELASPHFHRMTTQDVIHTYNYFNDPGDTLPVFGEFSSWFWHAHPEIARRAPHHQLPAFKQMNGGRFHLPELLDLDSVGVPAYDATLEQRIEDYETTLQLLYWGRYDPLNTAFYGWPNGGFSAMLGKVGAAAELSRQTGRRYVPVPGSVTYLSTRDSVLTFDVEYDTVIAGGDTTITADTIPLTAGIDTIASHAPTESELFGIMSLTLAYGATGALWYLFGSYPAAEKIDKYQNDTVFTTLGYDCCWGAGGFFTKDTLDNVLHPLELHYKLPNGGPDYPADVVHTIPDVYMGWRDQTRAAKRINRWLKRIGPELTRLRWRDGYSMHFIVPWPGSSLDTVSRPLPETEIVNEVTSRSPFKAEPDSAHRTFVEVGFFDKVTDSTGGQYDPLKDQYHVMLFNRRCFRKPKDTCWSGYCDVTSEDTSVNILDTLSGTRIISCRLNLQHPDTTGYNLWRVREIEPDAEPLPFAPLVSRHMLDTVLAGDSIFSVVLSPGKSTLIRIEPALPDTTIVAGDLRWPGQRKFIHDGRRYHGFFHKARSLPGGGTDNVIVWRWSYPLADTAGAIQWVPTPVVISDSVQAGDVPRTDNRFPSFTARRIADSTWITVVWTCHPNGSGHNGEREVVARNIKIVDVIQPEPYQWITGWNTSTIFNVDYHRGTNAEQWGTPVVSFTHGAAVIAWSDSTLGIVGRLFARNAVHWNPPYPTPTLSARDSISWPETQTYGFAGQYPTLPPWTPTARADSSVGASWRQPAASSQDILYQRLGHTPADALVTLKTGALVLAPWLASRWYPSIDIVQDTSGSDHNEGVVWEDDFNGLKTLQFQSLKTSSSGTTSLWNRAAYIVRTDDSITTWPSGELFPQTAVLGEHDTSLFGQGRVQFSIGYQRPTLTFTPDLWQALVDWGRPTFKSGWPNRYSYDGRYPNVAANRDQSWRKEAILYQAIDVGGTDSTLRTSRQFFAKHARPTGYQAEGRSVLFRVDAATRTGMQVLFYDPWFADAEDAAGLPMADRDTALSDVEELDDVATLFRTKAFAASDSVTVGCMLYGRFFGDAEEAGTNSVDVIVELIDSASGDAVAVIDSIRLSAAEDSIALHPEGTFDLLSGTYYVAVRFGTASLATESVAYDCRYPVTEVAGWVENGPSAKGVRRLTGEAGAGGARMTAQPNPFTGETEVRFSIPMRDHVTVTVYDVSGRRIERLIDGELFEQGRYAVAFSGDGLPPGPYVIELRTSRERVVEKVMMR